MVKELSRLYENFVVSLMSRRQRREPFQKGPAWRAGEKLQLIHKDMCGSIKPESNKNKKKRHFITFIDDLSRKTDIFNDIEFRFVFNVFYQFEGINIIF